MALTSIEIVKLLVGDVEGNPFTPLLADDEYQYFITTYGSPVTAAKQAAISISYKLAAMPTKERYGDVEVWNEVSKQYLAALGAFIKDTSTSSLLDALPYGTSSCYADALSSLRLNCECSTSIYSQIYLSIFCTPCP